MACKSLREWLNRLNSLDLLRQVRKPVDLRFELSALGKKADGKYALFFENPGSSSIPVVTGIASSREMFAQAMDVPMHQMTEHFAWAQSNPMDCRLVSSENAPVKEIVHEQVDLGTLPIPVHHEKDGGPYITAGILVAKNPKTGIRNVSIHRLQVLSPNLMGILILPRHLAALYQGAEEAGQPLDVAVAIGLDPLLMLASQALTPPGVDEFNIAGALYGEALDLVKCNTVDVEVPAQAEIIIEGKLLPKVREMEGPFGEYPKYYGPAALRPVLEVTGITSRRKPIYQTIIPACMEHLLLGAIPREGALLQLLRNTVPSTSRVHLTPGGTCRYHVVVAIDKKTEGEAKNAAFAALSSSHEIKHVVVVDNDVDIFDPLDVEWAVATRCQADRDVFIVGGAAGNKLDPSSNDGLSDKMGIDATVPLSADQERFQRIRIPGEQDLSMDDYLENGDLSGDYLA